METHENAFQEERREKRGGEMGQESATTIDEATSNQGVGAIK